MHDLKSLTVLFKLAQWCKGNVLKDLGHSQAQGDTSWNRSHVPRLVRSTVKSSSWNVKLLVTFPLESSFDHKEQTTPSIISNALISTRCFLNFGAWNGCSWQGSTCAPMFCATSPHFTPLDLWNIFKSLCITHSQSSRVVIQPARFQQQCLQQNRLFNKTTSLLQSLHISSAAN